MEALLNSVAMIYSKKKYRVTKKRRCEGCDSISFLLHKRGPADLSVPALQPNLSYVENFMGTPYLSLQCKFFNLTFRQMFLLSVTKFQGRSSDFTSFRVHSRERDGESWPCVLCAVQN